MTARSELTPQMRAYDDRFADQGEIRWLPYLMYFHPTDHSSSVVSTDRAGFRYSVDRDGERYSVADPGRRPSEGVRVLAGSSTVFGIGASADAWTLSSRLTAHDPRPERWLNLGGRSFNSTQELLLMVLYRHLLPPVKQIVLFSGFNNLGLARLPADRRLDHGGFFCCNPFFDALVEPRGWLRGKRARATDTSVPALDEQLAIAAELTLRHLAIWRALARDLGASLAYVLQPLAGWVRTTPCREERALFAELDRAGGFSEAYGDIERQVICRDYAARIAEGARALDVPFVNLSPILADALPADRWQFVDRIHFTDQGHDFVAQQLLARGELR